MTLIHISLDAMGGDNAPDEVCKGALIALSEMSDIRITLVGDETKVRGAVEKFASNYDKERLAVLHAPESIAMDELPAMALRKKRFSSMRIALEMIKSGDAQCFVSAGNTGAIVAGGILVLGRIKGIDRPGLGALFPGLGGTTMLIDVGATVRSKPENLYQFAVMGSIYMKSILGMEKPRVALISNGEEEIKGDDVISKTREMLSESHLNYVGYIEGKDITRGVVEVAVCDGFTGNIVLKAVEGVMESLYSLIKDEFKTSFLPKLGVIFFIPMLKRLWNRVNYEQYGGTPLLGVEGVVIKAHGRSKANAIKSAIKVAREFHVNNGVERIREAIISGG